MSSLVISDRVVKCDAYKDDTDITEVILEEGVEVIEKGAFSNCYNIEEVTFPESLRVIEDYAFCGCSSICGCIEFGSTLEKIGSRAFGGCIMLTEAVIPNENCEIHEMSFQEMVAITREYGGAEVEKDTITVRQVEEERKYAKVNPADINNGVLIIPEGYTILGVGACIDYADEITAVKLPSTMKVIGARAFDHTRLKEFIANEALEVIDNSAFKKCYELERVILTGNIKTIGAFAFYGCDKLTEFVMPSNTVALGERAVPNNVW